MLVRAIEKGYYGHVLREAGQIFKLKPVDGYKIDKFGKKVKHHWTEQDQFSEIWMEKVTPKVVAAAPAPSKGKKVGNRPAPKDAAEVAAQISKAEALMASADNDQAAVDAEAEEIAAAQDEQSEDEEADVI
jgi:hypothetical protein